MTMFLILFYLYFIFPNSYVSKYQIPTSVRMITMNGSTYDVAIVSNFIYGKYRL